MFVDCQQYTGSWGRHVVGKWFAALQCKTIHDFVKRPLIPHNNDDFSVHCVINSRCILLSNKVIIDLLHVQYDGFWKQRETERERERERRERERAPPVSAPEKIAVFTSKGRLCIICVENHKGLVNKCLKMSLDVRTKTLSKNSKNLKFMVWKYFSLMEA